MPNFLPILLAGGAILAISGKKKPKGSGGIPLDKPVQVKKDGLVVNSGRSPVPPAVHEAPLEPFEDVQQVQEALIAVGKPPKGGADGDWGGQSQAALDSYNDDRGFKAEARDHLATPDSLRALHADASQGTAQGVLANPQTGAGTTLFCSLSNPKCPPGQHCLPLFNTPIPGFEDIGYCAPIAMLEAGHKPTPEEYAPGGFNEVVFSPDFESVAIGGGWRFQTLEPWLYTRMKAGKLLTFAIEGRLFWEDLISKTPKSFWNSTLASVGLAVPAGAAIGTKGWLSYRKEFRREIPIWKDTTIQRKKWVRIWDGPRGYIPGGDRLSEFVLSGKDPHKAMGAKGGGAAGLNWPPPAHIVETNAGWSTIEKTGSRARLFEPRSGLHPPRTEIHPNAPKGIPDPNLEKYGPPTNGSSQSLFIDRLDSVDAPPGKQMYEIWGSGIDTYKTGGEKYIWVAASSMDKAIDIAKSKSESRVSRMLQLWAGDSFEVKAPFPGKEISGHTIGWAKPHLKQVAKGIGVQMAFAAVVAGTIYGSDYLAKKLGDKQRDLIAESAILAWKDFSASNYVRVGNEQVRIDQLPEVIAVQFFQAFVAQSILRFQKNTYE